MSAWNITLETILTLAGMAAGLWVQSVRFARVFEGHDRAIDEARRLAAELRRDIDDLEARDRAQSTANAAAAHLYQQQLAEFREIVAQSYATKRDLEAIETRNGATLERIDKRLDLMSDKLDGLRSETVQILRLQGGSA